MTAYTVVDYSWGRPDPQCLRSKGIVGVMRYLSWDRTGKNLTRAEANRLHTAGLWIGLNWEGTGNWVEFSGGAAEGARAGREAARLCADLGAPANTPIFVSADYQAPRHHWDTIAAWLAGFQAAVQTSTGRDIGFYGQGDLGNWLLHRGIVKYFWQTNAHGWGGVSDRADLYQQMWTKLCGADIDPNVLARDPHGTPRWAWGPHGTANPQGDDMTPEQSRKLDATLMYAKSVSEHFPDTEKLARDARNDAAKAVIQSAQNAKKLDEILARLDAGAADTSGAA